MLANEIEKIVYFAPVNSVGKKLLRKIKQGSISFITRRNSIN